MVICSGVPPLSGNALFGRMKLPVCGVGLERNDIARLRRGHGLKVPAAGTAVVRRVPLWLRGSHHTWPTRIEAHIVLLDVLEGLRELRRRAEIPRATETAERKNDNLAQSDMAEVITVGEG
jgi:hypothetical protein